MLPSQALDVESGLDWIQQLIVPFGPKRGTRLKLGAWQQGLDSRFAG